MKNFLPWFCLFLLLTLGISPAVRADDSASIESMVTEEVVAVATVDLTQVKLPQLIKWGVESGLVAESEAKNIKFSATAAQGWVSGLVDSGVQRITVLGQISDIQTQAPIWVATLKTGEDPEVALEALAGTVELLPIKSQALASVVWQQRHATRGARDVTGSTSSI